MKKLALITAGLALTTASLVGCSSSSSSSSPSSSTPSAAVSNSASESPASDSPSMADTAGYTSEIENNFVSNCTKTAVSKGSAQGVAEGACKCAWRAIVAEIPYSDFLAADNAAAAGKSPDPELGAKLTSLSEQCSADPNAF